MHVVVRGHVQEQPSQCLGTPAAQSGCLHVCVCLGSGCWPPVASSMQGRAGEVAQAMGLQSTRAHHKQARRRAAETHWAWRIAGCAECFQVSIMRRSSTVPVPPRATQHKKLVSLLDLCVSSLRRGHANLLCIVPILTDDPRKEFRCMTYQQIQTSQTCALAPLQLGSPIPTKLDQQFLNSDLFNAGARR